MCYLYAQTVYATVKNRLKCLNSVYFFVNLTVLQYVS